MKNQCIREKGHFSDDSDIEEEINFVEPPVKKSRSRILDENEGIIRSGALKYRRIIDANRYSHFSSNPSSHLDHFVMSDAKQTSNENYLGGNVPYRTSGSANFLSNKENLTKETSFTKNDEDEIEFLGKSPKISTPYPAKNRSLLTGASVIPYISPTFKFNPTVTSTAERNGGLGATKRKPLKSFLKSPYDTDRILKRSTKSLIRRSSPDIGKYHKKTFNRFAKRDPFTLFKSINFTTPQQSYRLEEKARYKELLQQFTTSNVVPITHTVYKSFFPSRTNIDNAAKTGALVQSHLDSSWTAREKLKLERESTANKSAHFETPQANYFPSGTRPKETEQVSTSTLNGGSTTPEIIELDPLDVTNSSQKPKSKEVIDDDIIITKEILKSKPRTNLLEQKLQKSKFYSYSWLKNLNDYHQDRNNKTKNDVEEILKAKKQCEENREKVERDLDEKVTKRISQLSVSFPTKVHEISEEEVLPELTPQIQHAIQLAFKGGPPGEVLADKFNIKITRRDIQTLAGLNWLNDEVINFYMNMIVERGHKEKFPSVYAFNTFFYSKLLKTGYSSVKRWTKKVDIFSHDLLLVPVHLGMHWCMAIVDFRAKCIRYFDSMLGSNNKCLSELAKYLESEHLDKKKSSFDVGSMSLENVKDIPQQMNGSDCGMFSCKFAEYLSRNATITFTQEHMPYFRRRMVYEIVTQKLM